MALEEILKLATASGFLMSSNRVFRSLGEATEKDLSPQVLVLDFGTSSKYWFADLRLCTVLYSVESSHRYYWPWLSSQVSTRILKSLRAVIGEQWRHRSTGVIWSLLCMLFGPNVASNLVAATFSVLFAQAFTEYECQPLRYIIIQKDAVQVSGYCWSKLCLASYKLQIHILA